MVGNQNFSESHRRLRNSTRGENSLYLNSWEYRDFNMKILTVNFLTCAVKACKTSSLSFPLHFKDAELEQSDIEYNASFLRNILPRIDWEAFKITANEVCASCQPLRTFAVYLCIHISNKYDLAPRLYSIAVSSITTSRSTLQFLFMELVTTHRFSSLARLHYRSQ